MSYGSDRGDIVPSANMASGNFSVAAPRFGGDSSFVRYESDLDTFYVLNNFSDDIRLRFLPLTLTGVARDAFDSIPQARKSHYLDALSALKECFNKPDSLDAHSKLRALKFDSRNSIT